MSRTPWVSFDGKDCSGCKHLNERGYCEFTACIIPCTVRATIPEVKQQIYSTNYTNTAICGEKRTNADRIRSMTDDELAHLLHSTEEHLFTGNLWNYEKWTEWLKQEA